MERISERPEEERAYIDRLIGELRKDLPSIEFGAITAERRLGFIRLLLDASQNLEVRRSRALLSWWG